MKKNLRLKEVNNPKKKTSNIDILLKKMYNNICEQLGDLVCCLIKNSRARHNWGSLLRFDFIIMITFENRS
jgi:hypothetical protein